MALTKATQVQAYGVNTTQGVPAQYAIDQFRYVENIAALRKEDPVINGAVYHVQYHTSRGYGGGFFQYLEGGQKEDDNGMCVVTDSGKRLYRIHDGISVNLWDFGGVPGELCDDAFDNAVKACSQFGIYRIDIKHPGVRSLGYKFGRKHTLDPSKVPLQIVGEDVKHTEGVRIRQMFNGVLFEVINTGSSHFIASSIRGFLFQLESGVADTDARPIVLSDAWRYSVLDCFFRDYKSRSAILVRNLNKWTENVRLHGLMSRACKGLVAFVKDGSSTTATPSFYGLDMDDCWFQANQPNSTGIQVGDGSNEVLIYSSKMFIGGWLEGGGGHNFIVAYNKASIDDTDVVLASDGYAGSTGTDLGQIVKRGREGVVDVRVQSRNSQATYADITSKKGTTLELPWLIAKNSDFPAQLTTDGRTTIRCRGARLRMKLVNVAAEANQRWTMWRLQPGSTYRCTIRTGSNYEGYSYSYLITTQGSTNVANVEYECGTANATAKGALKCSTVDDLEAGSTSANNGLKFDVVIDGAKPVAQNRTIYIELEML